ncbi:MAG TPA: hypothetical protein VHD38_00300 [Candidatus Paceibacterota bacterium]|nr:hypothetical protein [Candidatus Paceibacterota bacterium]
MRIGIVAFFIVILVYAYFEARGLLFGPRISLPAQMQTVHEQFITISGRAERIDVLTMQGAPVDVTEDGAFSEPYLLTPGLNRIVFKATDKYGHSSTDVIQVVYQPATSTEAAVAATSTIGTTATSTDSTSTDQVAH